MERVYLQKSWWKRERNMKQSRIRVWTVICQNMPITHQSFHYRFIKASKQQLYGDWSGRHNKFGVIARKGA